MIADSQPADGRMTVEEYIKLEKTSQTKHEFVGGFTPPDDIITLESIGLTCPVATFYRRTQV